MKTLTSKFQLLVKTFLCTLLAVASVNVIAQSNVSDIGGLVSADDGQEWLTNFELKNPDEIFGYLYGKQTIVDILDQKGARGIRIVNGLDENGIVRLVFYAANQHGEIIGKAYDVSNLCPPYCDSDHLVSNIETIGSSIDEVLAKTWNANFTAEFPSQIASYLYGRKIVNEIISPSNVKGIYFGNAYDSDNRFQLLLVGTDKDGVKLFSKPIGGHGQSSVSEEITAQVK